MNVNLTYFRVCCLFIVSLSTVFFLRLELRFSIICFPQTFSDSWQQGHFRDSLCLSVYNGSVHYHEPQVKKCGIWGQVSCTCQEFVFLRKKLLELFWQSKATWVDHQALWPLYYTQLGFTEKWGRGVTTGLAILYVPPYLIIQTPHSLNMTLVS